MILFSALYIAMKWMSNNPPAQVILIGCSKFCCAKYITEKYAKPALMSHWAPSCQQNLAGTLQFPFNCVCISFFKILLWCVFVMVLRSCSTVFISRSLSGLSLVKCRSLRMIMWNSENSKQIWLMSKS